MAKVEQKEDEKERYQQGQIVGSDRVWIVDTEPETPVAIEDQAALVRILNNQLKIIKGIL